MLQDQHHEPSPTRQARFLRNNRKQAAPIPGNLAFPGGPMMNRRDGNLLVFLPRQSDPLWNFRRGWTRSDRTTRIRTQVGG